MTYEELLGECAKQGFTLVPNTQRLHTFKVIARFDRGLGPEYVNLNPVTAKTINEANEMAWKEACLYFDPKKLGFENSVLNEVRIRPQ